MILRLSQKLRSKINVGQLQTLPLDENPFADWSASLFVADRIQYILVSNTKSLYSTVMYGKGLTNDKQFIERTLVAIQDFMDADGLKTAYRRFIAPETGTVRFAKALNRSVTGSINELTFHAKLKLQTHEHSLHDVELSLNEELLSAIAPTKSQQYGEPGKVFREMMNSVE